MKRTLVLLSLAVSICVFGCAAKENEQDGTDTAIREDRVPVESRLSETVESTSPSLTPSPSRSLSSTPGRTVTQETIDIEPAPKADVPKAQKMTVPAPSVSEATPALNSSEMKVATALERNPMLSAKIRPLLPARTTVTRSAAGFKKQKDFIAALHVSRNLGIPFNQIKAKMTGEDRMSLNDALRELRPDMDKKAAKTEVQRAEAQAKFDENQAKDEAKKAAAQEKLAARWKS